MDPFSSQFPSDLGSLLSTPNVPETGLQVASNTRRVPPGAAPRAIVELSHAMPDIRLIPFAVVGEKWRDEPWWTSGATLRLLLSEYAKYVAAEVRVRLADAGLELTPELVDQPTGSLPRRPATAQAN